ncbi:MAG: tRNA 2-thiouridine(34) synthase MnmA [Oscillospiraceae bacterium]|nr:tRNA 2-thiouridine(34) synthase MnmA [Oscillospiraceae bacterium]
MAKKVLVALSGGVDSSVAVHLLREKGYEVAGLVMKMSPVHDKVVEAAKKSAEQLGIPLIIRDLQEEFKREIIDFFASEYLSGRTPSPCVRCNPRIKFKYLLDTAIENGFDFIATGHYAKILYEDGVYKLTFSESEARDQSYMLAGLGQDVLSKLLLPISDYEKPKVREIAKSIGLECHDAPDSEENCFVTDNDYALYIEKNYRTSDEGDFISPEGKVCGKHKGILHYTIGQRKGLGIALGKPAYVTDIDPVTNEVRLGYEKAQVTKVLIENVSETFDGAIANGMRAKCKLRSTGKLLDCVVELTDDGAVLHLDLPTARVSNGQAAAIYAEGFVLGNGTICGGN